MRRDELVVVEAYPKHIPNINKLCYFTKFCETQVKMKVVIFGATTFNIDDNAGIGVSSGSKSVHEVSVFFSIFSL